MSKDLTIIIQAGGLGRRLQKYTKNCPKALVSVNTSTLLYQNLDILSVAFPDANFLVIADHNVDIIKSYFKSYPHPSQPEVIIPVGKGTASGLADIFSKYKPKSLLFIWCDLLIDHTDILALEIESGNDILALSKTFGCRWSFTESNKLEEVFSKQRGVAGLFYFDNINALISKIPSSGEFVKWLSLQDEYNPKTFFLEKTLELGELKDYEDNFIQNVSRARFFNKVTIGKDLVTKECVDTDYDNLLENEIDWYQYVNKKSYAHSPGLYSTNPLCIDKIKGSHPDSLQGSELIIKSCINALNSLHSIETIPCSNEDIKSVYLDKTLSRIEKVAALLPLDNEHIHINGELHVNPFAKHQKEAFIDLALTTLENSNVEFTPIHGDPTFSNTLYCMNSQTSYLIDPRGIFGSSKIYGDPYYDFAKLLYSVQGGYDEFNKKNFDLIKYSNNDFHLALPQSPYLQYSNLIYESVKSRARLDLIHSLIWFSLCGYVKDHIDSIIGGFLKGIIIYNKFKSTILELSSLPKTWILDVDGTMVMHNSHFDSQDVKPLNGITELLSKISTNDLIVIISARQGEDLIHITNYILSVCPNIRISVIDSAPFGERIIFNDLKPSGLKTAFSVNVERDRGVETPAFIINKSL